MLIEDLNLIEFEELVVFLQDVIRRRKAEFSKTEREIEERLAEADGKEFSRATTPDSDDKDSQVDKSQGQYLSYLVN